MNVLPHLFCTAMLGFVQFAQADAELYFPPTACCQWESEAPEDLGWDLDALADFEAWLDAEGTDAFIVLHRGRIVRERYFGTSQIDDMFNWFSAGKTVTALLAGVAVDRELLSLHAPVSTYLGSGWTSLDAPQELLITPFHQITMTTGLEYEVANLNCTSPACLTFRAPAGSQWYYHNAPYTLLISVVEAATEMAINSLVSEVLSPTGINGQFQQLGLTRGFRSIARDLARFGLIIQSGGRWGQSIVVEDESFMASSLSSSQDLNPAYGYLWWLNGQKAFMLPGSAQVFPGMFAPDAPPTIVSALGFGGQVLSLDPASGLMIVRLTAGGLGPGAEAFVNEMWQRFGAVTDVRNLFADRFEAVTAPEETTPGG